jgi:hypothetical protein
VRTREAVEVVSCSLERWCGVSVLAVTVLDFGSGEHTDEVAAELTDEHAASSYGQPVMVVAGEVYGAGDLVRLPSGGLVPAGKLRLRLPENLDTPSQVTLVRLWRCMGEALGC